MAKKKHPRNIDLQKYVLVLALTIIIFGSGVALGNWVASKKFTSVENLGQELRTDIIALELQQDLIEADPCRETGLGPLSQQLYTLGTRLDFMESRLGTNNEEVIRLKQYYSLIEIRHWLFMREINQGCNQSNVLILYFYSNLNDCSKCEEQGYVLSYLHKKHPDVMIYSFDKNMNNPALDTIKEEFNIHQAPTIVINTDAYPGYQSRNFIERMISYYQGEEEREEEAVEQQEQQEQ
ncbi:hypothetical protein KY348_00370 [Candidatus Woesearchaeota archaeon]|nr:hypothetical protein [Candidatus Woesearchaeota archaeon]